MRISDLDFILVPEWLASPDAREPDDDHWISRWQRNIPTASWLDTRELSPPEALLRQSAANTRPTIIITHGHGVDALLSAGPALGKPSVAGAFIVAPLPSIDAAPLAFPAVVIASDDHPDLATDAAKEFSERIGSHFVAAGSAGCIDSSSGQGPWPEGLMRLGWFLKRLSAH